MANPVKQLQRKSEEYQRLDKADRRRFWSDGILNNALYILMVIFIVYTAIKNKNFLSAGSIANIVSLVAASLPMAPMAMPISARVSTGASLMPSPTNARFAFFGLF